MRKSRIIVAMAGVALVPLVLVGCSSGGSTSGSSGKLALTVEDYFDPPASGILDKIYQTCAKAEGDTITSSHVPGAGLIAKVLQQTSSKTLPDVLMLDNPDVQQIAASGALSPIAQYGVKSDGFAPAVVKAGTYQGKLYGLAPAINSIGLFYNTDIFTAAGLTPPKTWAELQSDAKTLTTGSQYGLAISAINTFEGTWQFLPFMWSNGGNEKNIDTPQTAQALQYVTGLLADGSVSKSALTWTQGDVLNQFTAGKAAMMINGPWNFGSLAKFPSLHWATAPLPTRLASQTLQSPLGGEAFTVPLSKNKAKMEAAGKIVSCITSAKNQKAIASTEGNVPASLAVAAEVAKTNKNVAAFATIVATARARTGELGADWPKAATKIYTAEQLALTGKATPADALKQAQSQ